MRVHFNSWRDTDHPKAGGSELVVDQYANGLHQRGHNIQVRAGEANGAPHDYAVSSGGGTYSQYLLGPLHHLRGSRHADVIVDIINGVGFYTPLYTTKPVVAMIHHIHDEQWPMFYGPTVAKVGSFQEHHLLPRAYRNSLIITGTSSIHDELVAMGFHQDRLRHVPYQPTISRSTEPVGLGSHPEPLFVAAGRLAAGKRIDLLLKMWDRVHPHTGGRLIIIGDGPDRDLLEAQAGPGVEFAGFVSEDEKLRLFHEAWVLVHAAAREGWGLVISEAGLAGTPSLGFAVPGVREAIVDKTTGLLATTDEEFVSRWIRLADDASLRERLGNQARIYADSLVAVDQIKLLEEVLQEAISLKDQRHQRFVPGKPLGSNAVCAAVPDPLHTPTHRPTVDQSWRAIAQQVGPSLSIVIPAYNEADRIPRLLDALASFVDVDHTEIIVVDDGSTDATAEIARLRFESFPNARVLELKTNQGKGAALRAGVAATRGDRVVFMDADMATDLRDLAPLLGALGDHAIAIGSRVAGGSEVSAGSRHRRLMGTSFNWMIQRLTPLGLSDTQCGFKAFRGPEAKVLFQLSEESGFAQDVEILTLANEMGLSIAEVPVRWTEVAGSKVDPVTDSVKTAAELIARRARGNHRAVIAGVTIETHDLDVAIAAKEIGQLLRTADTIFVGEGSVHVLLPGAPWGTVPTIGQRLADSVDATYAGRWSVSAKGVIDTTTSHEVFEEQAPALT